MLNKTEEGKWLGQKNKETGKENMKKAAAEAAAAAATAAVDLVLGRKSPVHRKRCPAI